MELEKLVRTNIKNLKPYTSARGKYSDGILLDANENAFGSVVKSDVKNLNRYPDPNQIELRKTLSDYLGVDSSNLFFGIGSDEIIDLIIRIFCEPGKSNVILPCPTYGMYEVACSINDVEVRKCTLDRNFDIDVDSTLKVIDDNSRIIFLCSPNNPTGNLLNRNRIKFLAQSFNGIIFIDEAYIDISEQHSFLPELKHYKNIIIIRTFSKAWGMAAARCGYCIAVEAVINLLFKVKAPYSINKFTEAAVLEALKNVNKKNGLVERILLEKEKLITELNSLENVIEVYPSDANFLLVKMKDAELVFNKLNEKEIRVRFFNHHPALDNCLRITIGKEEENHLLTEALKELK